VDTADGSGEAILGYRKVEKGAAFEWNDAKFHLETTGRMHARNAVSAAIAAEHFGIAADAAAAALSGFQGVAGRMDRAPGTGDLDAYIDGYGYLPESLAENLAASRDMHPRRRHILIYQLLVVDELPEAQEPLHASLAKWDKVLIASYQSAGLMVAAREDYLLGLEASLRERGVDATYIGPLENCLTVLPGLVETGDVLFFSVHPRSADLALRIAHHTSAHENTHHQQYARHPGG
jgi:UDP-N-acetylmuramate-alanine ligase